MAWLTRDSRGKQWYKIHVEKPGFYALKPSGAKWYGFTVRLSAEDYERLFPNGPHLEPGGGPVEVELVETEKYKIFDWYLDQLTELCHKQMAGEKVEYVRIGSPLINRQSALLEQLGEDLDDVRGPAGVWSAVGKMEKKIKAWRAQEDGENG